MNTMNIIDLHCDTLIKLHEQGCGLEDVQGHIDLDALRRGGALVQCFAVYTPTHEQVHKHKITTGPWEYFNTAADIFDREMEKHKELIRPVRCAADIKENMDAGRISAMLTLEDGVCIDGRMERVQQLYDRGVRMIALTWNYENSIGFPNSVDPKLHALGLKPFGFEVVERMGELGMIVDVSHLSEGGFFDVAEAVRAQPQPHRPAAACPWRPRRRVRGELLFELSHRDRLHSDRRYPAAHGIHRGQGRDRSRRARFGL